MALLPRRNQDISNCWLYLPHCGLQHSCKTPSLDQITML